MKVKLLLWMLALACGGAVLAFWMNRSRSLTAADSDRDKVEDPASSLIADAARRSNAEGRGLQNEPGGASLDPVEDDDDEEPQRTSEEKKLAADIEKALDEEDFELAKKCAPLAMKCKVTEIRQSMVDTLAWFDEKAIPELTPFLVDPDDDVAESALNAWDSAVSNVEDESEKINMVEMAMKVISNEDGLESISSEYIGVDEKLAVESLLRVIESGGSAKGIEKAKETYAFVTGDDYTDRAAAEKWLAEECEPSESSAK